MRILLVVASLLLLSSCGKVQDPEFRRIDNFGLKKLGFSESIIGFDVVYFNPNRFGLSVKETMLNVFVDSMQIGTFNQVRQIEVANEQEFRIPLEASVSIEKALDLNIPGLVGKEVLVSAEGTTRVGRAGVFITKDIRYSGRHKINADLIKNPAGAGSNR
jgi:hypothetical protein